MVINFAKDIQYLQHPSLSMSPSTAETSQTGMIVRRDAFCIDWLVSTRPFQCSSEIMLWSPSFTSYADNSNIWYMTIHQSQDSPSILVTIMNEIWRDPRNGLDKSGFVFEVGLVNKDGADISLGSGITKKNGACVIRCNKSVAEFCPFVTKSCEGRLILFCKQALR